MGSMRYKFGLDRANSELTKDMDFGLEDFVKNKYMPYVLMALVILVVNLPQTYSLTNSLASKLRLDGWILDPKGAPTMFGVGLHAIVSVLLIILLKKYLLKQD